MAKKNKKFKKAAKMNLNSFLNLAEEKSDKKDKQIIKKLETKLSQERIINKESKINIDINSSEKIQVKPNTKIEAKINEFTEVITEKIKTENKFTELENKNNLTITEEIPSIKNNYPYLLLSSFYNSQTNKTTLVFYDEDTNKIVNIDDQTNHKPYFIVKLSNESTRKVLESSPEFSVLKEKILKIEIVNKIDRLFLKNVTCTKIYTVSPSEVPKIRRIFQDQNIPTFESEIRYHLNYLYDQELIPGMHYKLIKGKFISSSPILQETKIPETKLESEILNFFKSDPRYSDLIDDFLPLFTENIPNLLLTAFDIEINSPKNVFPKATEAGYPISCIAISNSDNNNFVFYMNENENENEKSLKHSDLPENTNVYIFNTEKELLFAFNDLIRTKPIIITYNGNEFDIPYIINRCKKLKVKNSPFEYDRRFKVGKFKFGIHIDLYSWFSNPAIRLYAYSGEYKDLKLGTVANALLNKSKYDFPGELWNLTGKELIYYNVNDSKITLELVTYSEYRTFKLITLLSRITHVPIDELTSKKVSSWLQYFFQFEHRRRNYLIPNSSEIRNFKGTQATSQAIIKDKKFQGAIVIEPKKGIHFDVTVLDFASLYPSIISSRNLSYETILCGHQECIPNIIPGTQYYVCKLENGIISQLIGFLKDIRVKWFKKLSKSTEIHPNAKYYSIIEKSLKVLINAAYGVLGAEFFSFYCLPVAEATTAIGRNLIEKTIEKCEDLGVNVIYGDTDSVFLSTPPQDIINEIITWSDTELGIPLEVDKEYRFIALTDRKKNYLGVLKNGHLDIKGLIGKKSNTPKCIQDSFSESTRILQEILSPEDFEGAKEKIKNVITELYDKIDKSKRLGSNKNGYNADELAFSVQLTKYTHQYGSNVQHVRAAKKYEDFIRSHQRNSTFRLQPGHIIKFLKGKDDVIPVEIVKIGFQIDVGAYKSQVDTAFSQVLDSLGINTTNIQNKVNLMDFMK